VDNQTNKKGRGHHRTALLLLALVMPAHHQIKSVGAAGQLSVRLLLFLQRLSVVLQETEDLLLVHLAAVTTANNQRQQARNQQIPLKVAECCPHHQGELGKQQ